MSKLLALQEKIGHTFTNINLLEVAFTHSSTGAKHNYERLEFLGDRVLGLAVSETLYEKFPNEPEGHLAKRLSALVQGSFLAIIAREMQLGQYIIFSDAESACGGAENDNILADVFESMIGALYLDSDYETCRALIRKLWADRFDTMKKPPQHPKTKLQEWAQSKNLPLPRYEIAAQSGPDHAPIFDIKLTIEGFDNITVQGPSRQEAEKRVATAFIEKHAKDMT
ncbi:MAG: ribonuclease III [Alphaproteobacteria bacterium]|nr:ribonuclease III [Alphaproteobacteria bacterium]